MSLDLTPLGYRQPPTEGDLREMAEIGAEATKGLAVYVLETLTGRHGATRARAVLDRTNLSIHWGTRMYHARPRSNHG